MENKRKNILFIHSGGVTSVVNTVASVIYDCAKRDDRQMYIAKFGVDGIANLDFLLASSITDTEWSKISQTPGSSFGSSRKRFPTDEKTLSQLFLRLEQLNIGILLCNGGNNSQCITKEIQDAADNRGYPLQCIGIPKTIDNDIYYTDTSPGFGSAAKYTATSVYEMSLDLASMCQSSTKVLIYEAMGRSTGWIAASSALARQGDHTAPHIILLPEASFSLQQIMTKVKTTLANHNHCVLVLAEGADDNERLLSANHQHYTYKSLYLNHLIATHLNIKCHVVIPDYLQRCARHIASAVDIDQTVALSKHAYSLAVSGKSRTMVTIKRESTKPYKYVVSDILLDEIAGKERLMPKGFLSEDQLHVSASCIDYLKPLIQGEIYPNFVNGIPDYSQLIYNNHKQKKDNDDIY